MPCFVCRQLGCRATCPLDVVEDRWASLCFSRALESDEAQATRQVNFWAGSFAEHICVLKKAYVVSSSTLITACQGMHGLPSVPHISEVLARAKNDGKLIELDDLSNVFQHALKAASKPNAGVLPAEGDVGIIQSVANLGLSAGSAAIGGVATLLEFVGLMNTSGSPSESQADDQSSGNQYAVLSVLDKDVDAIVASATSGAHGLFSSFLLQSPPGLSSPAGNGSELRLQPFSLPQLIREALPGLAHLHSHGAELTHDCLQTVIPRTLQRGMAKIVATDSLGPAIVFAKPIASLVSPDKRRAINPSTPVKQAPQGVLARAMSAVAMVASPLSPFTSPAAKSAPVHQRVASAFDDIDVAAVGSTAGHASSAAAGASVDGAASRASSRTRDEIQTAVAVTSLRAHYAVLECRRDGLQRECDTLKARALQYCQQKQQEHCKSVLKAKMIVSRRLAVVESQVINLMTTLHAIEDARDSLAYTSVLSQSTKALKGLTTALEAADVDTVLDDLQGAIGDSRSAAAALDRDLAAAEVDSDALEEEFQLLGSTTARVAAPSTPSKQQQITADLKQRLAALRSPEPTAPSPAAVGSTPTPTRAPAAAQ